MDPLSLVEDGAQGLVRIADAFRSKYINVLGIYLIKLTGHAGDERCIVRLVTDERNVHLKRRMIAALVDLRRSGDFPSHEDSVHFDIVPLDDPEASRIIDYAQRMGRKPPIIIRDVMWQGLFIEYAAVAIVPRRDRAAA